MLPLLQVLVWDPKLIFWPSVLQLSFAFYKIWAAMWKGVSKNVSKLWLLWYHLEKESMFKEHLIANEKQVNDDKYCYLLPWVATLESKSETLQGKSCARPIKGLYYTKMRSRLGMWKLKKSLYKQIFLSKIPLGSIAIESDYEYSRIIECQHWKRWIEMSSSLTP